uniref:ATP synthase complex subunit 8 n=1 Tax=Dichotrachelus manueli TaxID=1315750 RepID=A0A3G2JZH4_9CUCU|nr:ATP synthase F0 subunit 8 [Dichotrachelus manueli]
MPQMSPINWLTLYFLFLIIFMMFIILNFYSFLYKPSTFLKNKHKIKMNWKW